MSKNKLNVDVEFCGKVWELCLDVVKYGNGRTAIQAYGRNDGEPFGIVTVNVPSAELGEGEILVKTWNDNVEWVPQVMMALPHVFKNTGRKVRVGYAMAEVWEFTPDAEPMSE